MTEAEAHDLLDELLTDLCDQLEGGPALWSRVRTPQERLDTLRTILNQTADNVRALNLSDEEAPRA